MQKRVLLSAFTALASIGSALAQDATTTNPLNAFIGAAESGAGAVKSATAQETPTTSSTSASSTSASSTSAAPPPPTSSAAAATSSGLSKGAEIGIIIGAIVAALLILALLVCLCCCLIRRHRRSTRNRNAMTDEEAKKFQSRAANPGREYNNRQSMEQHPAMPLMAAAAMPHGGHGQAPSLSQHPALRDDHRDHHVGRDAALLGAGGLTAHEAGKHHGHRHNESVNTTAGLPPSTPHSSHYLGRDMGYAGAGGAAAYEAEKHHHSNNQPSAVAGGFGNDPNRLSNNHFGRDAGLAGGLAGYEAENHHHSHNKPTNMSGGIGSNKAPHTGNHHLGRDTAIAGAGGLAAYEAGKHHQSHQDLGNAKVHDSAVSSGSGVGGIANGVNHRSQGHQRDAGFEPTTTTGGGDSVSAPYSRNHPLGDDAAGLAGAGGLAAYEAEKHHHNREPSSTSGTFGASTDPYYGNQTTGNQAPPAYSGGLGSQPIEQSGSTHHYGRDVGIAAAGGVAAHEAENHQENKRQSKIENPFVPRPPSPRRSTPSSRAGPTEALAAGAIPETGPLRDHSESRSQSRPRSGGLPTHNDRDRPPTPFGLSGIGQPYEDMHVHHLVTDPPSQDLQQSPRGHEAPLASGALGGAAEAAASSNHPHHETRRSRGYATPPEVPSRSPNRAGRNPAQLVANSSFDSSISSTTRDSSSGTEQYQHRPDPYAPAQHAQIAPWESHHSRFSQSPPVSATNMAPPPKPWSDPDYVHHQRRQSHSPRQSLQYDGRRKSRSPATSINGQPRRLRFEDLQAAGEVPPTPTTTSAHQYMPGGYAPVGGHESYDGYDQTRWSQGVGEAL